MRGFADAIAASGFSQMLATAQWVTPTLQIVHILCIAILAASVLMVDLRILGFTGRSQSISQTVDRFVPWFWAALAVLAATGALMIATEPVRELMSLSFWLKMALVAAGSALALALMRYARVADARPVPAMGGLALAGGPGGRSRTLSVSGGPGGGLGGDPRGAPGGVRALGWVTLLIWIGVIFMGRFIAYDPQVWGAWSPLY